MKTFKKILKTILFILLALIGAFGIFLLVAVISDYKPSAEEVVFKSDNPSVLKDSTILTILTWNIGYAGLDKDMDFFYDGGTKVRTPEAKCLENLQGIGNFLKSNDSVDFVILQEVDRNSKRSYRTDQFSSISEKMTGFESYFGKNYDAFFVPTPPAKPMGKVVSGIATFSKNTPGSVTRYQLPGEFGFPTKLFYLDRCFMVTRYKVQDGKELVLVNTHNEAFDEGDIRKMQMEALKTFIMNEFNSGNYVIAGGDWNQTPPDFIPAFANNVVNKEQMAMESGFMPQEWKWLYDPSTPSNRSVVTAYDPKSTGTTVIDFFIVSPNIEPVFVKGINLNFENSDHNPVIATIKLK